MTNEKIVVLAEHPHIATLWVQLNAAALQNPDRDVEIVVHHERIVRCERLIIIGQPKRKAVAHAHAAATTQVVRMQHTDRLAAGWRTG